MLIVLCLALINANAGNTGIKTIVIDAGHGGKDPGAIGAGKINEKDIALSVALKVGEMIQKNFPDVNVIFTRKTDVFLELHERAEIANKNKADLFMAIHCNSSTSPGLYGTSTYVLGLHRTEANLEVAKRENSVILLEDDRDKHYEFDPNTPEGHIIMSMKQNAFLDQSIDIASKIENQYETFAKRKSLGVKQAGFYVIYKTAMPSLLSEIGFISNLEEEKFLNSAKGQEQIATSLFKAFKDYKFEMENSEGEQFAYEEAKKKSAEQEAKDTAAEKLLAQQNQAPQKEAAPKEQASQAAPESQPAKQEPKAEAKQPTANNSSNTTAQNEPSKSDDPTVALLSGRRIKKPLDNGSGGGATATKEEAPAPVKEEPQPAPKEEPKKEAPKQEPKKTEPKPAPKKTEEKPVVAEEKPEAQPVEAKPAPKKEAAKPEPKKEEPKPVVKEEPKKAEPKPVAENKPEPKKVEPKPQPVKQEPKAEPVKAAGDGAIEFKVQIIALKGRYKDYDQTIKTFPQLAKEENAEGLIRYYICTVKTMAEAKKYQQRAIDAGFKDAFIVGMKNGTRLTGGQLKEYEH